MKPYTYIVICTAIVAVRIEADNPTVAKRLALSGVDSEPVAIDSAIGIIRGEITIDKALHAYVAND